MSSVLIKMLREAKGAHYGDLTVHLQIQLPNIHNTFILISTFKKNTLSRLLVLTRTIKIGKCEGEEENYSSLTSKTQESIIATEQVSISVSSEK